MAGWRGELVGGADHVITVSSLLSTATTLDVQTLFHFPRHSQGRGGGSATVCRVSEAAGTATGGGRGV